MLLSSVREVLLIKVMYYFVEGYGTLLSSVLEVLLMKVEYDFTGEYVTRPSSVRIFFSIRIFIASQ